MEFHHGSVFGGGGACYLESSTVMNDRQRSDNERSARLHGAGLRNPCPSSICRAAPITRIASCRLESPTAMIDRQREVITSDRPGFTEAGLRNPCSSSICYAALITRFASCYLESAAPITRFASCCLASSIAMGLLGQASIFEPEFFPKHQTWTYPGNAREEKRHNRYK